MAVTPGTRLGSYEIAAQIGVGGMGEVYQAKDTNLGRDVAIKLLPEAFSQDADRLARFEREARTLASLNHPNIAIIHGLERIGDVRALVMELVDGPTLAHRIAQGPIPSDEAAHIARQIADALEAAHDQGIVHRDLKPANVKVRPDGVVKVLDFGLAKLNESGSVNVRSDPTLSPTITSPAMTGVGMILGTAAYMAPEQAAGKATDKRADIWSFGVVLWEMLTGERLFASAESTSHVLADVLRGPIAFDKIPAGPLQDLVRRCLDRDVKSRLRDIGEARVALGRPLTPSTTPLVDAHHAGTGGVRVAWAVAGALAIFSGVALWAPWRVEPERSLVRLDVDLGSDVALSGSAAQVILSPDGTRLAYVASRAGGQSRLYIRRLDQDEPMELPGTEGAFLAQAFSPDSRSLAFSSPTGAYRISVDGGAPIRLTANLGRGLLSWGRDGSLLAWGPDRGVGRIPPGGGDPVEFTKLANAESMHAQPHVLPGGKAILFTAGARLSDITSIEVVSATGGERKNVIPNGMSPHYLSSGHLLYLSQGTIFAVRFDPNTLKTQGDPVPMVTDVRTTVQGRVSSGVFSISENGMLVYRKGTDSTVPAAVGANTKVDIIDPGGKRSPFLTKPGVYRHLRFSPDGSQLAFTVIQAAGGRDVWAYDRLRDSMTRLSFDGGEEPSWSRPDGRFLLFASVGRNREVFWARPGSGNPPQRLLASPAEIPWSWAPDGKKLAYFSRSREKTLSLTGSARGLIFTVPVTEESGALKAGTPEPFSPPQFAEYEAEFSPDGRWIAFTTDRSGQFEVMVRAFPLPASGQAFEVKVSNNGGSEARWSSTARELLYVEGDRLMSVAYVVNGDAFVPQRPRVRVEKLGSTEWDLAPDGRIVIVTPIEVSATSPAPPAEHTVVFLQNFDAEVRRRVK